jgi:recombinational DNA repair protein RecT
MSKKTVLKLLISKFGPMSVDMQTAQLADQSVVSDDYEYVDNDTTQINERLEKAKGSKLALGNFTEPKMPDPVKADRLAESDPSNAMGGITYEDVKAIME